MTSQIIYHEVMEFSPSNFPHALANPRHRLAGRVIDLVFMPITLYIGWFVWAMVIWAGGRSPGMQIVKMRVYSIDTCKPVTWGHMALREFVLPFTASLWPIIFIAIGRSTDHPVYFLVVGYLPYLAISLVDAFWVFHGKTRQRLVDVIARTIVLNECLPANNG
jgi:uncharacterized RDD family membrane protein YckC